MKTHLNFSKTSEIKTGLRFTIVLLFLYQIPGFSDCSLYAQLKQIHPTWGGYVQCFLVDENEIFCGTNHGGIYYSADYGENWQSRNQGLSDRSIRNIVKSNAVILASSNYNIYRSTDNGLTWQFISPGPGASDFYGIIAIDSTVYVGTRFGRIYKSTDLGLSWDQVYWGGAHEVIVNFKLLGNHVVACVKGDDGGVLVADKDGLIWEYENEGLSETAVADCIAVDSLYFIATSTGVYRSTDTSFNWVPVNDDIGMSCITTCNGNIFASASYYGAVFRSSDYGNSWTTITDEKFGDYNEDFAIVNDCILLGVINYGILRSCDNGDSWELYNKGLSNISISDIIHMDNTLFINITGLGIWKSDDNGKTWSHTSDDIPDIYILSMDCNANTLFAGTDNQGIYRSMDKGESWENLNNGISSDYRIRKIKVFGDTIFASAESDKTYISKTNGDSWGLVSLPYGARAVDFEIINDIVIACTYGDGIYRSTNYGMNWSKVLGTPHSYKDLDKVGNTVLAASRGQSILQSNDEGISWKYITYNLPGNYNECIDIAGDYIVTGLWTEGIYEKYDGTTEWDFVGNMDVTTAPLYNCLTFYDNSLFTGTRGFGLWYMYYPVLGENEPNTQNQKPDIDLTENHLTISAKSDLSNQIMDIRIISISGRTVYNEILNSQQTIRINVADYVPGVYLVNVRSKNFISTKKILIQ